MNKTTVTQTLADFAVEPLETRDVAGYVCGWFITYSPFSMQWVCFWRY